MNVTVLGVARGGRVIGSSVSSFQLELIREVLES
jgi:hypothetical protein